MKQFKNSLLSILFLFTVGLLINYQSFATERSKTEKHYYIVKANTAGHCIAILSSNPCKVPLTLQTHNSIGDYYGFEFSKAKGENLNLLSRYLVQPEQFRASRDTNNKITVDSRLYLCSRKLSQAELNRYLLSLHLQKKSQADHYLRFSPILKTEKKPIPAKVLVV